MCKVLLYWFACSHHIKIRLSHCNGAYTRHGIQGSPLLCVSQPYLEICLPVQCGPCLHKEWDGDWNNKMDRARTFLRELEDGRIDDIEDGHEGEHTSPEPVKERHTIGEKQVAGGVYGYEKAVRTIVKMVESLKDEYDSRLWSNRQRFPPQLKDFERKHPRAKVNVQVHSEHPLGCMRQHGYSPLAPSPLAIELQTEDIILPEKNSRSAFIGTGVEFEELLNPWGNPATSYDNPIYAIDGDWVDSFLALPAGEDEDEVEEQEVAEEHPKVNVGHFQIDQEESSAESSVADAIFDSDCSWGVDSWTSASINRPDESSGSWEVDPDVGYQCSELEWGLADTVESEEEASQHMPIFQVHPAHIPIKEEQNADGSGNSKLSLDDIVSEFWKAVNTSTPKQSQAVPTTATFFPAATKNIGARSTDTNPHVSCYNPASRGKGDEIVSLAVNTSDYEIMRRHIQHLRATAPEEYYRSVLEIARSEIRVIENASSGTLRFIPSP